MWKWRPMTSMCVMSIARRSTAIMSSLAMPNLSSARPVVMWAWVWAPTSGLIRKLTRARIFNSVASCSMTSSSSMLSTLNMPMEALRASLISQSALPTPAKAISLAGNPASRAARISPPLTQSAPKPAAAIWRRTSGLALALMA